MNSNDIYFELNTVLQTISKGQYLGDILPEIPTNTILSKTVPGIGATTLEIKSNRHSIIIEPNVPVIKGKVIKHKKQNLFGVYEGVSTDDVIEYLSAPLKRGECKKLMTTPESFFKIIRAMHILQIDFRKDYMLLYDECDKIIKDVDYRESIEFPIEDFFLFENKAFVSATPILPSDPRFEQQDFQVIKINPDYDYKQKLNLVTTNNVVAIFRDILKLSENQENICIFLNSTDTIHAIIQKFGLNDKSKVYCSEDSVYKLKDLGYKNAFSDLQLNNHKQAKLAQYTFFTSRFFSAVDIDSEIKPTIILVSDLFYAKHSMIDPNTEAIQVSGRFRNGIRNMIHVSNIDYKLSHKSPEQLQSYLDGCHEIYLQLKSLFATATDTGIRDTLQEALERVSYARYIDSDGNKKYFAIDNYFDDERVKGYYASEHFLKSAYEETNYFLVNHQHIKRPLSDEDRLKIERADNKKERRLTIIEQLDRLNGESGVYDEPLFREFRDSLHDEDSLIVEVYEELGEDYAKLNMMRDKKMKLDLIQHRSEHGEDRFAIMTSIYEIFKEGGKYKVRYIKETIREIYSKYGDNTLYQTDKIEDFFIVDKNVRKQGKRAYLLINKRYK